MEKFTTKYHDFLHESLEDKFKGKLDKKYETLKNGILILVEDSVDNSEDLVNVQNYINESSESLDDSPLIGFVDDADIYDFYIKYQTDIDDICNNNAWFSKTPTEENIFSLYQYIINGSKYGVKQCLKILQKEMF